MKVLAMPQKSAHAGNLILVNDQYPYCSGNVESSLVPVHSNSMVLMERRAAVLLSKLMSSIEGWEEISAVSGWRSRGEQQKIYDQSLRDSGVAFTEKFVARPNHSEHQTGLAIDLGLRKQEIDFIRPDLATSFSRRLLSCCASCKDLSISSFTKSSSLSCKNCVIRRSSKRTTSSSASARM